MTTTYMKRLWLTIGLESLVIPAGHHSTTGVIITIAGAWIVALIVVR